MKKLQLAVEIITIYLFFLLFPATGITETYNAAGWILGSGFYIYEEPDLSSACTGTGGAIEGYIPFTEQVNDFYYVPFGCFGSEPTGWCYFPECSRLDSAPVIISPDEMQQILGEDNRIVYSYGDQSEEIRTIQEKFNELYIYVEDDQLSVSGEMNNETIAEIRSFQMKQCLPATGMVDNRTYRKLQALIQLNKSGPDTTTDVKQHGRKIVPILFPIEFGFQTEFWHEEDCYPYLYVQHKYTVNGESWYGIAMSGGNKETIECLVPDYTLDLITEDEYMQTQEGIELNVPNLTMDFYPAEKVDWFLDEAPRYFYGARIYDCHTGIVWEANVIGASEHIDAEPASVEDTARLCRIYEVSSAKEIRDMALYAPRPCLLTVGEKTYACSVCGVPEEHYPDRSDNKFNGQLCIFFTGSTNHTGQTASSHNQAIQYAWEHAPNSNLPFSSYMIRGQWGDLYWGINSKSQLTINGKDSVFGSAIGDFSESSANAWKQYKESIQSVVMRQGIVRIGSKAFKGLSEIRRITIPSSIQSIGSEAFEGCRSLTEIDFEGWNNIAVEDYAFANCTSLIQFAPGFNDGGITSLGEGIFQNCTSLSSLTIPSGIDAISDRLCENCSNLNNVVFEGQITSIGDYAFAGCFPNQETVQLPASTIRIGSYAFSNCGGLKNMTIPGAVQHLSGNLFSGCRNLERITILSRDAVIDQYLLEGVPNNIILYGYAGSSAEQFATVNDIPFVDLESAAAADPEDFIIENHVLIAYRGIGGTVRVPEGVSAIGYNAFQGSSCRDAIEKIVLPSSCSEIQSSAFQNCENLKEIELSENLVYIGDGAFAHCSSLKSIRLPESLQSLGYAAFADCVSLISINVPASLQDLSDNVFDSCKALQNVLLEDGLKMLSHSLFRNCTSLEEIIVPGSVECIEARAFEYCTGLKRFIAREGLERVEGFAFYSCTGLEAMVLPSTLIQFASTSLAMTGNGNKIILFIDPATSLQSIPYNCVVVSRAAPDFVLPAQIQHIENNAFQNSKARWVYIPDGCLSIGDQAFFNCPDLWQIRVPESCCFGEDPIFDWNQEIVILGIPGSPAVEYASKHYNVSFLSFSEYNRLNAFR